MYNNNIDPFKNVSYWFFSKLNIYERLRIQAWQKEKAKLKFYYEKTKLSKFYRGIFAKINSIFL